MTQIKIKPDPMLGNFVMPERKSRDAAAYDLVMPVAGKLRPSMAFTKVDLGFSLEIPTGYAAILLPRSGVGSRHGLRLRNTEGLIDPDYRGPVVAFLTVESNLDFEIGDRLLQMRIVQVPDTELVRVDQLGDTERGAGGFGSTGA